MSEQMGAGSGGSRPRSVWSGVLSLIIPGLGQIYAGAWSLGVAILVIAWLADVALRLATETIPLTRLTFAIVMVGGVGLIAILFVGAAIDAARRARRSTPAPRRAWSRSTWVAAIVAGTVNAATAYIMPIEWPTFSIPSGGQAPALMIGDLVAVDTRTSHALPARGEVVVFRFPRDTRVDYVKRLIGLPGDQIQLRAGVLYINGQPIPRDPVDDYSFDNDGMLVQTKRFREILPNGKHYMILKITDQGVANNTPVYNVPNGYFFALGDNRDNSADSRFLNAVGYIPAANLVGVARVIWWSRDSARRFSRVE